MTQGLTHPDIVDLAKEQVEDPGGQDREEREADPGALAPADSRQQRIWGRRGLGHS